MVRNRRHVIVGALIIAGVLIATLIVQIGLGWKRALDDVDAMIVTPASLPSQQSAAAYHPNAGGNGAASGGANGTATAPTDTTGATDPINILLMGTDMRAGQQAGRTDAMILVHIDPDTKHVSLLSFPRDLWVDIPGHGKNRINASFPIGELSIGAGYGPALAKETVSNLVGVPVHNFVLINFEGFKTVIDQIGGIYVDVPRVIDDPSYPVDEFEGDTRTKEVHFDAGRQLLNGENALIYARTRHVDNDFGRNHRQQQVLLAIFDRIREKGLLTQLDSLDTYTGALRDYVRTDLSRSQMLQLAGTGAQLQADGVARYAIGPGMVIVLEQPATFAADPTALRELVSEMTGGSKQPNSSEEFR